MKNFLLKRIFIYNNYQMFKRIYYPLRQQICKCSITPQEKRKPIVTLDKKINELIQQERLKPRKNEGINQRLEVKMPKLIVDAMYCASGDYPEAALRRDAANLHRYLTSKLPPPERSMIESKYIEERENIQQELENSQMKDNVFLSDIHRETMKSVKSKITAWSPIQYDAYRSVMYMVARGVEDYVILYTIMNEIHSRDPKFKPKTLLDFGSGIGTVSWAVCEIWPKSLNERVCVDISSDMNDLSENLMKLVDKNVKGVGFYRQYLPIASPNTYDIVVSALSLLELPNRKMRIETIGKLWKSTEKYLVLVENGTKGGFQIISEARDYIRQLINVKKKRNPEYKGFILSPCPHDSDCPQFTKVDSKCTFKTPYFRPIFGRQQQLKSVTYTYVVFKKGAERDEKDYWPRMVQPVLLPSRQAICRMCTSAGKLEEIIFSKGKHEQSLFRCAKHSRWGDRLPIAIDVNKEE